VPYREVTPNQAKKFLTGKGHAEKNLILLKTFQKYGIECDNDNVADAINFNMIGRAVLGWTEAENEAQREVVAQLNGAPKSKVKKPKKPKAA
jgi:Holliday junction resolvasome RuvABC endonuclease subunit